MTTLHKLCIGSALVFMTACQGEPQDHSLLSTDPHYIVGGEIVAPEDRQQVVLLREVHTYGDDKVIEDFVCTGVAIAPQIVLTASHCLNDEASYHTVSIPRSGEEKIYVIKAYSRHPDYQNNKIDLALVLLEEPLPSFVSLAQLPQKPFNSEVVKAFGYGLTSGIPESTTFDDTLRTVDLKVFKEDFKTNEFYVDQSSGKGICSGDSGGPAFSTTNPHEIVGIASRVRYFNSEGFNDRCGFLGIYFQVYPFKAWIAKATVELLEAL